MPWINMRFQPTSLGSLCEAGGTLRSGLFEGFLYSKSLTAIKIKRRKERKKSRNRSGRAPPHDPVEDFHCL